MAGREQQQHVRREDDVPDDDATPTPPPAAPQGQDADVDALLDDIDDVLEANAEQFVRGFVQKGGQ
ncbi:ubiquitin-like protein Pup [Luteimicrobium sp. NPDC057192]|jgi:ubiquitin-like protein Pup|uniref:ubiquitin-like protein Pup n=1 Tax=Luteimicrobium sp. NPDC057192 TaxID=3346042 RepID=UPI002D147106|nr:ubiquitin-like protein Pup [Luteimicrobium sp.]